MYRFINSTDPKIIGQEDFQIKAIPNHDYLAEKSIRWINFDKPIDYEPYLKSFIINHRSKLTDMLSHISNAFLINEKLLNIFLQSNIEHYQYFESNVIYHKKDYKYYFFFIYGQDYSLVDYQNMKFWAMDERYYYENKTRRMEAKIDKPETLINWAKIKTYPYVEYPYLEYEALKLNHVNIHTDMIRLPFLLDGSYFVSEALKSKIEAAKCTGVDFDTVARRGKPII